MDDPDITFLLSGGFAFYDSLGNVLGALALAQRDTEFFMHFGEPCALLCDDADRYIKMIYTAACVFKTASLMRDSGYTPQAAGYQPQWIKFGRQEPCILHSYIRMKNFLEHHFHRSVALHISFEIRLIHMMAAIDIFLFFLLNDMYYLWSNSKSLI